MTSFPFNFTEDIDKLMNESINNFESIKNLYSPVNSNNTNLFKITKEYFQSILNGDNHHVLMDITKKSNNLSNNILIPFINDWNGNISIDNLVIINHPNDAQRLTETNIKKAPVFQNIIKDSIIATTDNDDWLSQRSDMNSLFMYDNLKEIFTKSKERAKYCIKLLSLRSNNYTKEIDMNDFFLNETQAQLQSALFGFDYKYIEKNNKKIRDVFIGRNSEYSEEFIKMTLNKCTQSESKLSKYITKNDDKDRMGTNILLFAFAGHDTTGHTLTWLLFELCRHPQYKQKLIEEIGEYWRRHKEATYESLNELPFMSKCIFETLRLWPALANGTYRQLEKEEEIIGIDGKSVSIKKGTYIQVFNWIKHRNPNLWGDAANIFDPNREFNEDEVWDKPFNLYHLESDRFSPFTYSPRNCLGKNFAHMEMRIILLNIFKNHDFVLTNEQKMIDEQNLSCNYFTMGPRDLKGKNIIGMYFNVYKKNSNL